MPVSCLATDKWVVNIIRGKGLWDKQTQVLVGSRFSWYIYKPQLCEVRTAACAIIYPWLLYVGLVAVRDHRLEDPPAEGQ